MLCFRRLLINQRSLVNQRCISSAAVKVDKSVLKELRSSTGFPFVKIKDALLKNENNPAKAAAWLHEQAKAENWQKAQKLSSRSTSQGLVGLYQAGNSVGAGTLLCETDFVARNSIFVNMLFRISQSVCDLSLGVLELSAEEVANLNSENKLISEHVVLTVGSLGENIKPGSSFAFKGTNNQTVSTYVHGAVKTELENFQMGSHVGVVLFEGAVEESLGKQIAQHIVGMNPAWVSSEDNDENCLVNQAMLHDASKTVGQIAEQEGFKILDFKRLTFLKPEEES